jgi:prophage regulatory protein
MHVLPETGFLRLRDIIGKPATNCQQAVPALVPVSASTWWAGVRTGRYPKPVRGLGVRITAWRVEDIRALISTAKQESQL